MRKSNVSRWNFVCNIFRRIFKVIWIRVNYISKVFQIKLHYAKLHITLRNICSYMTSRKKKVRCHWKYGIALKFSEGGIVGVSSNNLIIVNILRKKETQTIIFVQLRYGIKFFNSRELSLILSFIRFLFFRENKLFNFLLFVKNRACEVTDNLWHTSNIPFPIPIPFENYKLCNQLIRMAEIDFCIWFSSSLPKPKFRLWFTNIMYKHILNLNRRTGDKQIWTLLGFL